MTRAQLAVPVVAALLGGVVTAAAMVAGGSGAGVAVRQQGLLDTGGGERLTPSEIYERAAPGVVYVRARTVQPGAEAFQTEAGSGLAVSAGSGFVLDEDGRVLTNAHVVSGVTAVEVTFGNGQSVAAQVEAKDEGTDLAVLRVSPDRLDLRPLELGESGGVQPGDAVVAIGNPTGFQPTAGTGRVLATGRRVEAPGGFLIDGVLHTDAVIEPATSGGPLLGADGRVIGISSRLASDTGFVVPSDVIREVLALLEEGHKVIRPYLGLHGRTVVDGVEVDSVDEGSPADAAGVANGDVVAAVAGRDVGTSADLLAEVERREPGDTLELEVLRNGSRGDVSVTLAERPATLNANPRR